MKAMVKKKKRTFAKLINSDDQVAELRGQLRASLDDLKRTKTVSITITCDKALRDILEYKAKQCKEPMSLNDYIVGVLNDYPGVLAELVDKNKELLAHLQLQDIRDSIAIISKDVDKLKSQKGLVEHSIDFDLRKAKYDHEQTIVNPHLEPVTLPFKKKSWWDTLFEWWIMFTGRYKNIITTEAIQTRHTVKAGKKQHWQKHLPRAVTAFKGNGAFRYDSAAAASRLLGIPRTSITACCQGKISEIGGYKFTYRAHQ